MAFSLLLLFALWATSLAVPAPVSYESHEPQHLDQCLHTACPITDFPKVGFRPNTTYVFDYEGTGLVQLEGLSKNASSSMQLRAEVHMTWLSPCQAAVAIKNPVMNAHAGDHIMTELLTSHPLIVSMKEGVVTSVCAHPHDHPTGLNMKKGIISSIQNSMPYFDPVAENKIYFESDVLGRCPTQYTAHALNGEYVVTKSKNHKDCDEQVSREAANPVTSWWMRAPLPLTASNSSCVQIWSADRVIKRVSCVDTNVLKPIIGFKTNITAKQWSKLTFKKVDDSKHVEPYREGRMTNLKFESVPQPKTLEVLARVELLLKELCSQTEDRIQEDAASTVATLIGLLYRVPEHTIRHILEDIKSGKYCKNAHRLESIFKDALIFVNNGGAVEVIIDDVLSGEVSGGRTPLYAIALQLYKKPCIHTVKSVSRLFDSAKAPPSMVLAGATLVSKYCRHHHHCMSEPEVREIYQKLSSSLHSSCSSSDTSEEKRVEALTALKAIGNMANVSRSLETAILDCVRSSEADTMVRVAAAQAFRQTSCKNQPTERLIRLVTRSDMKTEVRIAAYVSAIRCASYEDASTILEKISEEPNTQVRSFILTHMRNIQTSDAPYLRELRYKLSSLIIPGNHERGMGMYSKNSDLSYYFPTLGLGGGFDTSIIYAPGSYIPRQWQANFTANIFDNVINIGEFAVRLEDIEALFEMAFGPEGFFRNKSSRKILQDIATLFENKGKKFKEHYDKEVKRSEKHEKHHSWNDAVPQILNMFKPRGDQSQKPKIDAFIRIFGQEISFASLMGDIRHIETDELIEKLVALITKTLLMMAEFDSSSGRVFQINSENFIVTQQGIPLQLKMVSTFLLAFRAAGDISLSKSTVNLTPDFSADMNAFVGYTLGAKAGLRTRGKMLYHHSFEVKVDTEEGRSTVQLDLKDKDGKLISEIHTSLVFKMPSKQDKIITPIEGSYPSNKMKGCSHSSQTSVGLRVCWDVEMPDYFQRSLFPLGQSRVTVTTQKSNPQKELLRLTGSWRNEPSSRMLSLQVDAPGAEAPRKVELEAEYKKSSELKSLLLYLQCSKAQRSLRLDLEPRTSRNGRKYELSIYTGVQKQITSADKVLMASVGGESTPDEKGAEFSLKTFNSLEDYVKATIEFDASVRLEEEDLFPRSIDLRKFEVDVAVPEYFRTTNSIRKDSAGGRSQEYQIESSTRIPSAEIFAVKGTAKSEGSLEGHDLDSAIDLQVKTERSTYKAIAKMAYNHREKTLKAQVKDSSKNLLLAELSSVRSNPSAPEWSAKAKFEIPKFSYSLEGDFKEQSASAYKVKLTAKRDQKPLYELEGPVSISRTREQMKEQSDLRLRSLESSREFQIKTKAVLSPESKMAALDLQENGKPLFAIEGDLSSKDLVQLSSSVGVHVPQIIEAKVKVEKSSDRIQAALNGFLRPNTAESQRLKGSSSIDLRQKQIRAKVAYDADRDPSRVVSVDAHYDYDRERKYGSVKGDVAICQEKYTYSYEAVLGTLAKERSPKNELKIKVTKPNGEVYFMVETGCDLPMESSREMKVDFKGKLQCSAKKLYKIDSKFSYDVSEAPKKLMVKGKADISTPKMKDLSISVDLKLDAKSEDQKLDCKVKVSGAELQRPIVTDIGLASSKSAMKSDIKLDFGATDLEVESKCHAAKNERHEIEDLSLEMSLRLPNQKVYQLRTAKSSNRELEISLISQGKKVLAWEHQSERPGVWKCRLTVPSREIEAQSKVTQQEVSLSLYPNKKDSDEKYEAKGHYKRKISYSKGESLSAGAEIRYPGSSKPVSVRTSLSRQHSSTEGTVELDIFKDPKDKVYIHVKSFKFDERSYKAVAEVKIPTRTSNPKVIAEAGLSSKVKLFKLFIEDGASPKPILDCAVSYNQPAKNHAYIYAHVKTKSRRAEVIASLQGHEMYKCRGGSINGTIRFGEEKKSYDFASSVCAPAYIEIGVKKSSESKMFLAKLGMKDSVSIKLALDLVHNSTKAFNITSVNKLENTLNLYGEHIYLPKQPVVLVGAKLWASTFVSLDAMYDAEKTEQYLDTIVKPMARSLRKLCKELCRMIPSELKKELEPLSSFSLIDELEKLKDEIVEAGSRFLEDIGFHFPSIDDLIDILKKWFYDAEDYFRKIYDKLKELLESIFGANLRFIQDLLREADKKIREAVKYVYRYLKEIYNDGLEALLKIKWVKWIVDTVEDSSMYRWIRRAYHRVAKYFEDKLESVQDYLREYYKQFKADLKELLDRIAQMGYFRKFIKWIESLLEEGDDDSETPIIASLAKKFYSVYLSDKAGLVRFQIPLQRPVASLSAAVQSVGIPSIYSSKYYHHIRRPSLAVQTLLSYPHSASAKIVGDKVITFDGMVIPYIFSECEIKIVSAEGVEVTIKRPSSERSEVSIKGDKGEAIKIKFSANESPEIEGLPASKKELKKPGVDATRLSDKEVKVDTKSLKITINKREIEVEAKPRAYNKVQGLLGTHDNEKSTDIERNSEVHHKPSSREGPHHLSPGAAKKLFISYKKSRRCQIPS